MISEKFRRQLRQCAREWREDGSISEEQYQQLSQRYHFDSIDTTARNRFIAIVVGLGAFLLSIGAIALVEAHWDIWSRELKIGILFALFLTVNICGFYLWRQLPATSTEILGWRHRLGQGLLLLGSLILGVNMTAIGDMFLVRTSLGEFLLGWGIGVLAIAFCLRLRLCGILATILIGASYWPGLAETSSTEGAFWVREIVKNMPLVAAFVSIPLGYWCRSRWIFFFAAIILILSLEVNLFVGLSILNVPTHWMLAIAYALPPTLLWSYDDEPWRLTALFEQSPTVPRFQPIARTLAIAFLAISFYLMSFHWFWSTGGETLPWQPPSSEAQVRQGFAYLFDVSIVLGGWIALSWSWHRTPGSTPVSSSDALISNAIAIPVAIATGTLFWHFGIESLPAIGPFIYNILLFLLGYGILRQGLARGRRSIFWWGTILFSIQTISRVMEYDTGLVIKAVLFLLSGAAIVIVGLWFERYAGTLNEE